MVERSVCLSFDSHPICILLCVHCLRRYDEHAKKNAAPGDQRTFRRAFLPYARLLELCDENGITESDDLKHRLEDWERWNREIRSGELTSTPAPLVGWSETREKSE